MTRCPTCGRPGVHLDPLACIAALRDALDRVAATAERLERADRLHAVVRAWRLDLGDRTAPPPAEALALAPAWVLDRRDGVDLRAALAALDSPPWLLVVAARHAAATCLDAETVALLSARAAIALVQNPALDLVAHAETLRLALARAVREAMSADDLAAAAEAVAVAERIWPALPSTRVDASHPEFTTLLDGFSRATHAHPAGRAPDPASPWERLRSPVLDLVLTDPACDGAVVQQAATTVLGEYYAWRLPYVARVLALPVLSDDQLALVVGGQWSRAFYTYTALLTSPRVRALETLVRQWPTDRRITPYLVRHAPDAATFDAQWAVLGAEDPDAAVRIAAEDPLPFLTTTHLLPLLEHASPAVRQAAVLALGRESPVVVPAHPPTPPMRARVGTTVEAHMAPVPATMHARVASRR